MDPYNLPEEFSNLQAQDMSKLGFMQDLIRGVKKIVGSEEQNTVVTHEIHKDSNNSALLRRIGLFLEDGAWKQANEYCERVLDEDPECSKAHLYKMMISHKIKLEEKITECSSDLENDADYRKAVRFARGSEKDAIIRYNEVIKNRIYEKSYQSAVQAMDEKRYSEAIEILKRIKKTDYKDIKNKIAECEQLSAEEDGFAEYQLACELIETSPSTYADYCEAYKIFKRLGDYKNSREKMQQCSKYIYEFENNAKFGYNQFEEEKVNRKPKTAERNKIKLIVILLIMLVITIYLIYINR